MENQLALSPGMRFKPTDMELIEYYLRPKVQSLPMPNIIKDAEVSKTDPWNLPGDHDEVRYFFSTLEAKYSVGTRSNRTTASGFWKASGKDRPVIDPKTKEVLGTKKILVFYQGRPQNGSKTNWILHEYKLPNSTNVNWVVCKIFTNRGTTNVEAVDQENVVGRLENGLGEVDLNMDGDQEPSSSEGSNDVGRMLNRGH